MRAVSIILTWLRQLDNLKTDYIDYGFIHCIDEMADWKQYRKNGAFAYLMQMKEQVEYLLGFFESEEGEKDYSVIGTFSPAEAVGKSVYCNHCKPCTKGLDIGIINKYYDLARNGDSMAAEHYRNLEIKADACVQCGHCEARCPFHVRQEGRMKEIGAYFGRKGVYDD